MENQFNFKTITEIVIHLSEGNPGAIVALSELLKAGYTEQVGMLLAYGIKGPGIWILYKDHNNENIHSLAKAITDKTPAELIALSQAR